jgi:hypothetical protein
MSFAIANNLLAPNTKATNLGIYPRATTTIAKNNSKNLEDGSFGMKHPKRYSYTMPYIPPEDKWGTMVKVLAMKSYPGQRSVRVDNKK